MVQAQASPMDEFSFYATHHPPLTFQKDNVMMGIVIDIFEKILVQMGAQKGRNDIVIVNWARAYNQVLNTPKSVLLDTYRTEEREKLFKWVGPLLTASPSLIAKKESHIKLRSPIDFNGYIIGTLRHDASEQLLLKTGVAPENLLHLSSPSHLAKLLAINRIDIWAYDELPATWILEQGGYNTDAYETVWTFAQPEHYIAFHRSTDDKLVEAAQKALDFLKKEGVVKDIIQKYIPHK